MKKIIVLSFYLATLFLVCFFWQKPVVCFVGLLILSILYFVFLNRKNALMIFITIGLLGSISEAICVYFGAWSYTIPNIFGIPIWLPLVWGMAGLCFWDINRFFQKADNK